MYITTIDANYLHQSIKKNFIPIQWQYLLIYMVSAYNPDLCIGQT